jgi:isoquinoline 1-oxidoreductase alpha subunit
MITLTVNGKTEAIDAEPETPLLWVLRDHLNLTGTKFGCGVAACGACTVHLDGRAVLACMMPLSACSRRKVTTIEGLSSEGKPHRVQQAWIDHQVPQCGYCQSGMIMAAAALLAAKPNASDEVISKGLTNICRCGTYPRVKKAMRALADANPVSKPGGRS